MTIKALADGSFAEQVYVPNGVTVLRNGSQVQLSDGSFADKVMPVGADGKPVGSWRMLAQSAVALSHTGSLVETPLVSIAMPALGPKAMIRIESLWAYTNDANTKTPRIKFDGQTMMLANLTLTNSHNDFRTICNRDNVAAQIVKAHSSTSPFGPTSGTPSTFTIDTRVSKTLSFTAQLADTTDTVTLHYYSVELYDPGA